MEPRQTRQEFLKLRKYNLIVKGFIREIKNQQTDREVLNLIYDRRVQNIKESFPELFALKESEILFSDDLIDFNPFRTLLYCAINSQWDSVKSTSSAVYLRNNYCDAFLDNLAFFASNKFFDIISDNSQSEQVKSLSRTISLYFYIRAPGSCFFLFRHTFDFLSDLQPIKIPETETVTETETETEAETETINVIEIFDSLKLSNIVRDTLTELFPDVSVDELFDRVCNNSFYAHFPFTLFGLTTIGHYVFVNSQFNEAIEICKAATLVTLLNESAHLARRFTKDQSAYLAPEKNESGDLIFDFEMGSFFEKRIFGVRLEYINENSASFLMKRENWDLSIGDFQNGLRQEYEKGEEEKLLRIRVGKNNELITGIDLGRCGMSVKF